MNKKNNRKGFTIVELVIVIAVIAILATVLIPTFGNVIERANQAAAKQEAKNIYTNYVMACLENKEAYGDDCWIDTGDYWVHIVGGAAEERELDKDAEPAAEEPILTVSGSTYTKTCQGITSDDDTKPECDWCGKKH